jgi:phosphoribosylglycinamide formyltransferase 1
MSNSIINNKIAVAVSGGGRSLENLIHLQSENQYQVDCVISSHASCGANEVAKKYNKELFLGDFSSVETAKLLYSFLNSRNIDLVVLAGFLKKFPTTPEWANRIINIHPALLPKYGGKGMYGSKVHNAVIEANETQSGATIHFVNDDYDDGKLISQIVVPISQGETSEKLAANVFKAECQLLPITVSNLLSKKWPRDDKIEVIYI